MFQRPLIKLDLPPYHVCSSAASACLVRCQSDLFDLEKHVFRQASDDDRQRIRHHESEAIDASIYKVTAGKVWIRSIILHISVTVAEVPASRHAKQPLPYQRPTRRPWFSTDRTEIELNNDEIDETRKHGRYRDDRLQSRLLGRRLRQQDRLGKTTLRLATATPQAPTSLLTYHSSRAPAPRSC